MSNQLKQTVDVYYKEGVIAQIRNGQYAVINCRGNELEENIIVKVPKDMAPVMFKDITGTVTVNGYVELFAEEGTAAKRVYLNIQVPSEYMLEGTYDSSYEYEIGDIVVYKGEVFVKIGEGQTKPVDGDIWQRFSGAIQDEKIVDVITHGKLEFLPDEGYVAMRKFTANIAVIPEFDGTIKKEPGFTTISGSYIIDQERAFNVLQKFIGIKTYTMSKVYGGGGVYTDTMTFDGTNYLIKYGEDVAFRSDNYMVEGNGFVLSEGARVNFDENTEVNREFKALFLSIADEYVG